MTDAALAALVGGFIVAGLTELISVGGTAINRVVPAWLKPILAIAAATWNPALLVIVPGAGPAVAVANAVIQWVAGKILHDVLMSQTGGLSGGLRKV